MIKNDLRVKVVSKAAVYGTMKHRFELKQSSSLRNRLKPLLATPKMALILAGCLAIFFGSFGIALEQWLSVRPARLSAAELNLLGDVREDASQYLAYDQKAKAYMFNPVASKDNGTDQSEHAGRNPDAFSASFPSNAGQGIAVTDTATKLTATLIPKFKTAAVKKQNDGHLIYTSEKGKLTYSLKYNGLKENIILSEAPKNGKDSYSFSLQLPAGVEARMESDGSIGIYSGGSALFGDISYGSEQDRGKVEKARLNSAKTKLLMGIPAPIVKDSSGKEYSDKAEFVLSKGELKRTKQASDIPNAPESLTTFTNYTLTLRAHGLKYLSYPIALDPTITVTSSGDFSNLNNTNGVDVDTTNNLIRRSSLSGGTVGSWSSGSTTYTKRWDAGGVSYNNNIYQIGGIDPATGLRTDTYSSATINTGTGDLGSWTDGVNHLVRTTNAHYTIAYNGYIYVLGGRNSGGTAIANVEFAKINRDGSLGTWADTASLTIERADGAAAVYNGYIYMIGGRSAASTNQSSVEAAQIKGDGTLAAWTTTGMTAMPSAAQTLAAAAYNGYLYEAGGGVTTVRYININSDSTLGSSWITTSSLPSAVDSFGMTAVSGYLYAGGGCTTHDGNGTCTGEASGVNYAQINADGTLGTWRTAPSLGQAQTYPYMVTSAGYVYVGGGCVDETFSGGNNICTSANTPNTIQYAKIKPAGELDNNTFTTDADTYANASYLATTVVYNGYLYIMGGCSATDCGTIENKVRYAVINADGSIGAFTTDAETLPAARFGHASFAYNGYLYVVGGCSAVTTGACSTFNTSTYYSLIGTSGNPGAWSTDSTNVFTTARFGHKAAVYNGFVYVSGGCSAGSCTTYQNDVWEAPINSTGDLGTFVSDDSFSTGRYMQASFAYNGYLYIVGGYSGSFQNDIQYAPIAADGTISAFTTNPNTNFTTARFGLNAVADKGYVYIVGGCSALASSRCSTYQSDIQYARINSSGTIDGTWNTTQSITSGRFGQGAAINAGFLYVVGGCTAASAGSSILSCTAQDNQVQYQFINNGGSGTVNSWTATTSLADPDGGGAKTAARIAQASVAYKGCLYVAGGVKISGGAVNYNDVQVATVNSDGTVNSWSSATSLPVTDGRATIAVYNDYLYVGDATGIYYIQITNTATCALAGSWSSQVAFTGTTTRISHRLSAYNGYLYVTGGQNAGNTASFNSTVYASINANGSLNSWTAGPSMNAAKSEHSQVVYNGYLYVIGGGTDTAGGVCNTAGDQPTYVESSLIDPSTGALGSFTRTTDIPWGSCAGTAFAANGYLYYMAGRNDTNNTLNTEGMYAPILPSGKVGEWQRTISRNTSGNYWHTSAFYNGYAYLIAGNDVSTETASVHFSKLSTIPRAGSFSKLYDFGVGVQPTKLITRGTKQTQSVTGLSYMNNNNTGTTFGSTTSVTDQGYGGANKLAIGLGTSVTLSRYFFLRYTINDSLSAIFPDSGNETTISDFDLYFHANTGSRLRGGRSFTDGTDRGLDTQP